MVFADSCPPAYLVTERPTRDYIGYTSNVYGGGSCVRCHRTCGSTAALLSHLKACKGRFGHLEPKDRRQRRKREVRAHTLGMRAMQAERRVTLRLVTDHARPQTRAECAGGIRPCPYVGCRWHLYLDVNPRTGALKLNFPDLEPDELQHSCALDVADNGGESLETVGAIANLTRERIRQIEAKAFEQLERSAVLQGLKEQR